MNEIKDFKDLVVWQRAMDLVAEVYQVVKKLPKEELYALSDQIRRAVISIPSNIAEGYGRNSSKEFSHFISIAKGSKSELEIISYIITLCKNRLLERIRHTKCDVLDRSSGENALFTSEKTNCKSMTTVHRSPLTVHCSLFTAHCSLKTWK